MKEMKNKKSINKSERLASVAVPKLIVSLAIPAIIAQMINALYNIVDRIYISRIPQIGNLALGGVGVCFPILILVSAFAQLVGVGGSTLASIELGKENKKKAEKMLGNGIVVLFLISIILMVVIQVIKYPILTAFGASQYTVTYGIEYLSIYLWGTIFVETTLGLNPFIICQGKSSIAMISVLIGAGLNIVLDPIFIFVLNMGVKGAAAATVLSQIVSSIWIIFFLLSSKSSIKIRKENFLVEKEIVMSIIALGISPFIMSFTECLINIVFNRGLQKYGGDYYVVSMTIIQSIMQLVYIFSNGITQGTQPVISFNYGAEFMDRVRNAYKLGFISHIFVSVISCILLMSCPVFFASFFTDNQEILSIVGKMLPIYICGWGIFGIQSGAQCAFVGLGQARISLFLACFRKVFLLIPIALILPYFCGVIGVFAAEPVSDIISAAVAGILFLIKINSILTGDNNKIQN